MKKKNKKLLQEMYVVSVQIQFFMTVYVYIYMFKIQLLASRTTVCRRYCCTRIKAFLINDN